MHREKIVHLLGNCWEEGRLPGTLFLDEQWPKKSWIEFPPTTEGVHHLWSSSDDFRCNLVYHILSFNPLRQSTTYDVLKVISLFLFIPFSASTLSSQTRVSEISSGKSINLSTGLWRMGGWWWCQLVIFLNFLLLAKKKTKRKQGSDIIKIQDFSWWGRQLNNSQ